MPTFEVKVPLGANQIWMRQQIREAVAEATRRGKLRPNSVDSITGENSGNNLGPGTPIIHFDQWESPDIEIKLILKGGGCENTNAQYSLPTELDHLGRADRSLEGVRKCILHAVWKAQGKGCSPGAVGVCIGGDRTSGYTHAKEQLFRTLDDRNPDARLAALEDVDHGGGQPADRRADGLQRPDVAHRLQDRRAESPAGELLRLGRLRLLGVPPARRTARRRRPARSRPGCTATRRPSVPLLSPEAVAAGFPRTGREIALQRADLGRAGSRRSRSATSCSISGRMFTGRDAVHAHLMKHEPPVDLSRRRSLPLRSGRGEGRRRLARHRGRPDDEHPRRALSGRDPQALRRAGRHRQGRHGREDAGRTQGVRRRLPERDRRRGAVLRALHRARRRRLADGVRHARKRCGTSTSAISRPSSRWTRTERACTRTSKTRRGRSSRR